MWPISRFECFTGPKGSNNYFYLVQSGEFNGLFSAGHCLGREVTFMDEHEK